MYNDLVLSRCPSNDKHEASEILLWRPFLSNGRAPDNTPPALKSEHVWTFSQKDADIWFLRFTTDSAYRVLAAGDHSGDISLWDMSAKSEQPFTILQSSNKRYEAVRCLTFSPNDDFMIAGSDDGTLWIWEIELPEIVTI